ncbi:MAG: right-handed parallel beta-helix repeat-containing protein, partial [Planctomycetota bacterium]
LLQLAAGRLCVHRGRILYGSEPVELPFEEPFRFGALDVAITLYAVENVEIRNLNIRHYRLDGIVAHDRCQRVRLVGVNAEANGRAGLTVGGTSHVAAASCRFRRNLEASVRIEEFGVFEADDCDLDSPPAILE